MDNLKMGELIREARKEKGLTQKDIAGKLGITDRAVSKWERGICAPDIAYIGELADILGLTVSELIAGERMEKAPMAETENAIRETIVYSRNELKARQKKANIKFWVACLILAVLAAMLCGFGLWYRGFFHRLGSYPAPDGQTVTTVYDCDLGYREPPSKGGFTLSDYGLFRGRTTYQNAQFRGLWWSPNSRLQVVSMATSEGIHLALCDYNRNIGVNLTHRLEQTLRDNGFFSDVPYDAEGWRPLISFEFLQWSEADPELMQLYFCYRDTSGQLQQGYMWYDYETHEASGHMRLEAGEKETDPFYGMLSDLLLP